MPNEKVQRWSLIGWYFFRVGGAFTGAVLMFGGTILSMEVIPRSTPWPLVVFLGGFIGGVVILGVALDYGGRRIDRLKGLS